MRAGLDRRAVPVLYEGRQKQCSVYVIPTSTPGTLASEVSMRFGFRGLSHVISTGCTSSTDAIGYAAREVERGTLEYVDRRRHGLTIAPLIIRGFQLMRIMTARWNDEPTRGSRPFSRDRDGFVLAEGAWFFVLEELEHARARGATFTARSRATARHARRSIGFVWRNAEKNRPGQSELRSRMLTCPQMRSITSSITAPQRS